MEKHFARFRHQQHAFVFAIGKIFEANGFWVTIAEIDALAGCRRDLRRERDGGPATLDSVFEGTDAAHMRRMRQDAPGNMFKFVPLFQKIIAAMVADFFNVPAMTDTDLVKMGRVND